MVHIPGDMNVSGNKGSNREETEETEDTQRENKTSPACQSSQEITDYLQAHTGLDQTQADTCWMKAQQQIVEILNRLKGYSESGEVAYFRADAHQVKGLFLQCGLGDCALMAQELYDCALTDQDRSMVSQNLHQMNERMRALTDDMSPDSAISDITAPEKQHETTIDNKKHLLILEDNLIIQDVVTEMCSMLGFEVETTTDGAAAVEAYSRRLSAARPFHSVLLDLNIPDGMGGREAAERILAMDKQAQLVVCSGNPEDPIMQAYQEYGFIGGLSKPYSFDQLKKLFSTRNS
jgi:CheY-like chemotaxis protein